MVVIKRSKPRSVAFLHMKASGETMDHNFESETGLTWTWEFVRLPQLDIDMCEKHL